MTTTELVVEPARSREDYLDAVRGVLDRIRSRSAEAEALRRMPDESIADLDSTGLFVALQPRRWGGLELDPATFFESVVLLGTACGATGWVGGVLAAHPWEVGCMHADAQAEVWEANPRARISSSYAPTGAARRVGDGLLVAGTWRFSSGVDHCDWALLGAMVPGEEERGPRVFLVRRSDFVVDESSWQVAGLSGTGSKDLVVEGAVIPEHRTHLMEELRDTAAHRPGCDVNPGSLYRLPWMNLFSSAITSPTLGAATGLVQEYVEQSSGRVGAFGGAPVATSAALHQRVAEALARVDVLTRSMTSSWRELYTVVEAGGDIDPTLAARGRYLGAKTIADSLDAALVAFAQAGGGAMHLSNPLQRYLRDLLAMRNHPMAALDRFATDQARLELGLNR